MASHHISKDRALTARQGQTVERGSAEHLEKLKGQWGRVLAKAKTMPERERSKWFREWIPGFRAEAKAAGFDLIFNPTVERSSAGEGMDAA